MNKIHVVLVDDHDVVRSGLASLLSTWSNINVKADYPSGELFLANLESLGDFDILILDNLLTGISGEETLDRLKLAGWSGKTIVLTMVSDSVLRESLLGKGVFRVLLKSDKPDILRDSIYEAVSDSRIDIPLQRKIKERITPREMEFLLLICDEREFTYDQIADFMKVHVRTIDGFRKSLFQKLNVKSKTGLVLFAVKHGILKK